MLEAFIISSDSRFRMLMILTEKKSARIWHNKFKIILSSNFDIANSEKVVLGYINKVILYFVAHQQVRS